MSQLETAAPDAPEIEPAEPEETPDPEAVAADEPEEAPAEADTNPEDEPEEAADPAPPETADPPSEEIPEPEPEPFGFRADGTEVAIEGAFARGETITIPRDAWNRVVQPHLADRRVWQQRETQYKRDLEAARTERTEKEQRAELVLQRFDAMLADPEALVAFFQNYDQNAARLRLEIENELLKSQHARLSTQDQERQKAEEREAFEEMARPGLKSALDHLLSGEQYKELGLDSQALHAKLWGMYERGTPLFFQAKEGDGSGVPAGQWAVDLDLVETFLEPARTAAQSVRQKSAAQVKAAEVRARNQQAVTGAKKPPPTAPAKGSPPPGDGPREFKNAEEYKAYMREKYKLPL